MILVNILLVWFFYPSFCDRENLISLAFYHLPLGTVLLSIYLNANLDYGFFTERFMNNNIFVVFVTVILNYF